VLSFGARGTAVRLVQHALGVRPANGRFGPLTRAAVLRFQRAHRLATDGVIGPRTWRALAGPAPRPRPPQPSRNHGAPPATPYRREVIALQHYSHRVLRMSAHGPAVQTVQRVLRVRADGQYGPQTTSSVLRWQHRHRLVADGVVGPATWHSLVVSVKHAEAHAVAVARARARAAAHARAVARARHLRAVVAAYQHTVLRVGAMGPAVQFVQHRLRIHADGVFGPRTLTAVEQFQRHRHLKPDGVVGTHTWRALG
jgi:peptidoglycan hydrolase-like protein with peptidoglycan-binding domain